MVLTLRQKRSNGQDNRQQFETSIPPNFVAGGMIKLLKYIFAHPVGSRLYLYIFNIPNVTKEFIKKTLKSDEKSNIHVFEIDRITVQYPKSIPPSIQCQ
jgi:hypothetical protein